MGTSMKERGADEIVLETEVTNEASLRLYERLGFLRSKRLHRYYLNGNTAFRLVLYLKEGAGLKRPIADPLMGPVPGMGESVDALLLRFRRRRLFEMGYRDDGIVYWLSGRGSELYCM